jgi:sulfate adenylyltransferase
MKLVPPHGGILKPLLLEGEELNPESIRAGTMPGIKLTSRETSDLIMMAIGAFSPLEGFMGSEDYKGVVNNMHMADGTLWPIPITLSVPKEQADQIELNSEVALIDEESNEIMGSMTVTEKYT